MRKTFIWLGMVMLLVVTAASVAPSMAQRSMGEALFKNGQKAYNDGNYRESTRLFQQVLDMKGATPFEESMILCALAESQRALGQYRQSEENFKKCLAITDTLPKKQRYYSGIFNCIGTLYQQLGRFNESEAFYTQAVETAPREFDKVLPVNGLARTYHMWGKLKEEEEYAQKGGQLATKNPKTLAKTYWLVNSAHLKERKGDYKEADATYKDALKACSELFGDKHYYNALILIDLSELYRKESRYQDAEKCLLDATKILSALSTDHPELLQTQVKLANIKCDLGQYSDARKLVESALKAQEVIFEGTENNHVANAQDCLGTILRQDGRYEEAQKTLEKALLTLQRALGPDHMDVATTMRHLAFVHEDQANFAEAEKLLIDSKGIIERNTGEDHPARATAATALAHLYLRENKLAEAEPLFKQSLDLSSKVLGEAHSVTATSAHDLGELYVKQGKFADAAIYLEKALNIDEKLYGANAPQVAADLTALATAYGAQGQSEKAAPLLQRAAAIKNVLPGGKTDNLAIPEALVAKGTDRPVTDKWALVVGISNFKDSSINLKFAAKDATDFRNFLVNSANFKNDHVKLLTDEAATRDNVIGMLGDKWLAKHVKPNDLVVVFVSSHGSAASENANGTNFLIAHDTNKNSLLATGIPMQWLTKLVAEQVKSDRVILILDVCHSGSAAGQKGLNRAAGLDPRAMSIGKGQMVICSSLAEQVSWESKNYENSVFTRRLIEALHSDNKKTTMLQAYKKLKVLVESEVLRDRGNLQTPVLVNKEWTGGDAVLSIEPARVMEASK